MDFCQPLSLCQPFLGHLLKHNTVSSQRRDRSRDIITKMLEIISLLKKIRPFTNEHLLLFSSENKILRQMKRNLQICPHESSFCGCSASSETRNPARYEKENLRILNETD